MKKKKLENFGSTFLIKLSTVFRANLTDLHVLCPKKFDAILTFNKSLFLSQQSVLFLDILWLKNGFKK